MTTAAGYQWTLARRIIIAAGAVWLAFATMGATDAVTGDWGLLILMLLGPATATAWVLYTLAWPGVFRSWRRALAWLAVPAVPFVAVVGYRTAWPMAMRVWLCERQLREYAESADTSTTPREAPTPVGLFDVHGVDRHPNVTFLTTGYAVFTVGGVAYCPAGSMTRPDWHYNATHLYGPWYRFSIAD